MSDFDKEAEREKLREKYEREEEKREATEQMSELLLKGATMTNAHCGDCGDPIFRYDGQEFCPSCQKPVDRQGEDATEDAADGNDRSAPAGDGTDGDHIQVTTPSDDATVRFGGTDGSTPPSETTADASDTTADASDTTADASDTTADASRTSADQYESSAHERPDAVTDPVERRPEPAPADAHRDSTTTGSSGGATGSGAPVTGSGTTAGDHLGRARVTLAQTVERFARRAADTDSPREAREHLRAAREAADALDAL